MRSGQARVRREDRSRPGRLERPHPALRPTPRSSPRLRGEGGAKRRMRGEADLGRLEQAPHPGPLRAIPGSSPGRARGTPFSPLAATGFAHLKVAGGFSHFAGEGRIAVERGGKAAGLRGKETATPGEAKGTPEEAKGTPAEARSARESRLFRDLHSTLADSAARPPPCPRPASPPSAEAAAAAPAVSKMRPGRA